MRIFRARDRRDEVHIDDSFDMVDVALLCNIAISKNNSLDILLKRQCALRMRKSWAMNAQDTLDIYDMGSIDDIFESDNPRLVKKHFKQALRKEWNRRLKEECAGKSSLRWLYLPPDEQLHIIWRDMNCQSHTRKATIKASMTTGCYMLQAYVKRLNVYNSSFLQSTIEVSETPSSPSQPGSPQFHSTPQKGRQTVNVTQPLLLLNVNCQSTIAKKAAFQELIDTHNPDIVCATETWLAGHHCDGGNRRPALVNQ